MDHTDFPSLRDLHDADLCDFCGRRESELVELTVGVMDVPSGLYGRYDDDEPTWPTAIDSRGHRLVCADRDRCTDRLDLSDVLNGSDDDGVEHWHRIARHGREIDPGWLQEPPW